MHGHKVLCLALVCIYTAEGEASGVEVVFSIHTNAVCMWPVKPGNETGFADWPEEEKLDSP